MVPETVAPEVGDVMLTTGGCAQAGDGEIPLQAKSASKITAQARLVRIA
jgi:hypothetical protein